MQNLGEPILKMTRKWSVRVLRPGEYEAIRQGVPTENGRVQMDGLLYSGMRYVEARRLQENPAWFAGRFIHLPPLAVLKSKRKQLDRWVWLDLPGREAISKFLKARPLPNNEAWAGDLRRWAERGKLDPSGLGPKTMRKTWESWLMATYPNRVAQICLSQGHTSATSLGHYLNMPFLSEDLARIKPYVEGIFEG